MQRIVKKYKGIVVDMTQVIAEPGTTIHIFFTLHIRNLFVVVKSPSPGRLWKFQGASLALNYSTVRAGYCFQRTLLPHITVVRGFESNIIVLDYLVPLVDRASDSTYDHLK